MRLVTLRTATGTVAAVADDGYYLPIVGHEDVGSLLANQDWREIAGRASRSGAVCALEADLAPVVTRPAKILCAGLNYRAHIVEMGRELPSYPTLFAKFASTLAGPFDDIALPADDERVDWEGEVAVVVGKAGRRIPRETAAEHIAGYTVANDLSMRSWQNRTNEWLQGKAWDHTTPLGPELVTPDEFDRDAAQLTTVVDGVVVQRHCVGDLLFTPEDLIAYASTFTQLMPGDVILTGTPGGVGHARTPQQYLTTGSTVAVRVDGLGQVSNSLVAERSPAGASIG